MVVMYWGTGGLPGKWVEKGLGDWRNENSWVGTVVGVVDSPQ